MNMKRLKVILAAIIGGSLIWGGIVSVNFIRDIFPSFLLPPARLSAFLGNEFAESVAEQVNAYGFVDFDQIADFEWSHLLIATPYQDPWQMLEDNGFRRQRINSGIKFEDWQNLLIFLNDGRVVTYINLRRGIADFRGTINPNQIFQRDNATFFVFSPESVWGWNGAQLAH